MPTYEYLCQACEHQFDEFQPITAKPLRKCPECGKQKLKRLIGTGAGIIFKGSGFYETDYRSDAYQKSAKAETDAGKPKDEKKADTKPATDAAKTQAKSEKPAAEATKSAEKPTKS